METKPEAQPEIEAKPQEIEPLEVEPPKIEPRKIEPQEIQPREDVVDAHAPSLPSFAQHLTETRVQDGDAVCLQCVLADAQARDVTVTWLKDNKPVTPSEDFKVRINILF